MRNVKCKRKCNGIVYTQILVGCALFAIPLHAQEHNDTLQFAGQQAQVTISRSSGKVSYYFESGVQLRNTVAYVEDVHAGYQVSAAFSRHRVTASPVRDSFGAGTHVQVTHEGERAPLRLIQHITLYENQPFLLVSVEAVRANASGALPETSNLSPLAVLPAQQGRVTVPGSEPRILDVPFDNDNWVKALARPWPDTPAHTVSGISYELAALYDRNKLAGLVTGSITHDCWKTGIAYRTGAARGMLDSFLVYGGAATEDNKALPAAYGGLDGTHDHAPHGAVSGISVRSPVIYLAGSHDMRQDFTAYGHANATRNGRLHWKGYAPFYWNSFGVEGVLGYTKKMMPPGVAKISDFLHSLDHFNQYAAPVLSIDSYDQSIYTTDLLASLGRYGRKRGQQLGFYFIPFAVWTWKNTVEQTKLGDTNISLGEVVLKDKHRQPIAYKDGDWGAYAIDPTHPAVRAHIISQLKKAKAIQATFLKIDFLTAGSLESVVRYDKRVRTGMQAYDQGMKMLKHLVDSILGPDVFITQAISPMFPHQYAHTRFISTDVYSHLRDDQPGFPAWGSTEASLATGSFMWWMQGTLWPYTNLDVAVMQHFQENPELTEQEVKVRLYAMMAMGSILGDGSDFRENLATDRAKRFLNNPELCAFFSQPRAFTPLRMADGDTPDQQLSFYLEGDTTMLALFNFAATTTFTETIPVKDIGLEDGRYAITELLTGRSLGTVAPGQSSISLTVPVKDALLVKLIPANDLSLK
ncbi:alpha-amylase family protein [Chitinophaga japonensis]|uniref:Alpha-galactosidase n=1 Tax=Chitinophaga japonensis TaxID=104662 RepID=A0A562T6A3_CHIJA|nr:hypothetical protein [Chitinophaga japonensis]TWI89022.1 hypothetical protein LX66_3115 [Chitinophaga japonensis]